MSFKLDFTIRRGTRDIAVMLVTESKVVGIAGPSGVGKTTALNCIAGLLTPDAGVITIDNTVMLDTSTSRNMPPECRKCGYVFQDMRLFPHLSVAENLHFGARFRKSDAQWAEPAAIIAMLDLAPLLSRDIATLSGGEARRVAIGRALLSAPKVLLLDEPLASLDAARAEEVLCYIERIRDDLDLPIVFVSHEPGHVARLTDTVLSLSLHSGV